MQAVSRCGFWWIFRCSLAIHLCCRYTVRIWKDGWEYFATLRAAIFVAELPSGESICCRTKDGLRDVLLLLYCVLPSMVGVESLEGENGKLALFPSKQKPFTWTISKWVEPGFDPLCTFHMRPQTGSKPVLITDFDSLLK